MRLLVSIALLGCGTTGEPPDRCRGYVSTPGQCTRSTIVEAPVDDPLLVSIRFSYIWQGEAPTPPQAFHWVVPRSRLEAIGDVSRERVSCERMDGGEGCPVWILPERVARVPPPPPGLAARQRICPAGGLGGATPSLDHSVLTAAFLPAAGEWRRIETSGATAVYALGTRRVRVAVNDMIRSCSGAAGTTDVLLDTEEAADSTAARRSVMSATSAVLVRWARVGWRDPKRLVMWVADRCRVVVDTISRGIGEDELVTVGHAVDVAYLATQCAKR